MWIDRLIELKKKAGMSSDQIAEGTRMPKRTISRIFHNETENPTITTLIPIINFLGGSLDEVFADTMAVVGNKTMADLQKKVDNLTAERDDLKEKVTAISAENEMLKMKLMHKEELLAVHNYYIKLNK